MARSLNTEGYAQIEVAASLEAEEPIAALLERLFGQPTSSWNNLETGRATVSTYVRTTPAALRQREPEIRGGLDLLRECGLELGKVEIRIRKVPREDWSESWKKFFKTIEIGSALLIKPSWSKRQPKQNQAVVVLDPGLSFGTGQHATTSFCLREIVRCRTPKAPQSFLDIGSGSGILSIAAARLGYAPVEAFDFDPLAVRVAAANCRRNRVENRIQLARRDLTKMAAGSRKKFDLICANLISTLLIEQQPRILNRLRPGGTLVLAGILATEFPLVHAAYEKAGLTLLRTRLEREWQSASFRLPPAYPVPKLPRPLKSTA